MQKTESIQYEARKAQVNSAVSKAQTAFLKKIVSDKSGFDPDIVIAAHFELERRSQWETHFW